MSGGAPRNGELEWLRGIAILGVVVLHSLTLIAYDNPGSPLSSASLFVILMFGFAVPFFFVISGYVLNKRHPRCDKPLNFIKKRLLSVLPAYLIFSIIYSLYNGETSIVDILSSMITFSASGHLWFVAVIIIFYVLYPAIIWLTDRVFGGNYRALVALSAIAQVGYYLIVRDHLPGLLAGISSFLGYILYFSIGIYLAKEGKLRKEARDQSTVLVCLSLTIVLSIVTTSLYYIIGNIDQWSKARELINPFIVTLMILAMYSTALRSADSIWAMRMKRLGTDSYGVYLVHALMISIISNDVLAHFLDQNEVMFYVLLVPMVLLSSYAIIELMGRNRTINRALRIRRE